MIGLEHKKELTKNIDFYEKIYLELKNWNSNKTLSKTTTATIGEVNSKNQQENMLNILQTLIESLKKNKLEIDDGFLYLKELIERDSPPFTNLNLILSPVGSGKTTFIKSLIEENETVLMLVSTTSLKNSLVPECEIEREKLSNRMFATGQKRIYGNGTHKIHVMTYAEFSERIKFTDTFAESFSKVFCDEIHSLPLYSEYSSKNLLLIALRYIFKYHERQKKFLFTATKESLDKLKEECSELFDKVNILDYLDHKEIKRYTPLSKYKLTNVEQVRSHLIARSHFINLNYKIFAFCKTIESQKKLKQICEEEGFKTQTYWSINNSENSMDTQQTLEIQEILRTGILPDKYDVVVINSAYQEGWNLVDKRVKLIFVNTTNETEYIQATGRFRSDVDILLYKTKDGNADYTINFPIELLGEPLTVEKKAELTLEFKLYDDNGRLLKWPSTAKILKKEGYSVEEKQITINGNRKRVSIVTWPTSQLKSVNK